MKKPRKKKRNIEIDESLLEKFDEMSSYYGELGKGGAHTVACMMFVMAEEQVRERFIALLAISERSGAGEKSFWEVLTGEVDDDSPVYAIRQLLLKPPQPRNKTRQNEKKGQ